MTNLCITLWTTIYMNYSEYLRMCVEAVFLIANTLLWIYKHLTFVGRFRYMYRTNCICNLFWSCHLNFYNHSWEITKSLRISQACTLKKVHNYPLKYQTTVWIQDLKCSSKPQIIKYYRPEWINWLMLYCPVFVHCLG